MNRPGLIYLVLGLLLVATAPWPFTEIDSTEILGFPPWAFYCLCMTVLFGAAVALVVEFCWPPSDGDEDGE